MSGLQQRVIEPELLDEADPALAESSLKDLTRINRYLGGYSTLRSLLMDAQPPAGPFTVLDVGAATGDMGATIREQFPEARVLSLDYKLNHLTRNPGPKVVADAFRTPFLPRSFDFVFSSLFLHHFTDGAVIELLRGFGRMARRAVLVIDLDRGPLGVHFIPATRWIFGWDPITVHDAAASVRAGFKAGELLELAVQAGLGPARVRVHRPWSRLSLYAAAPSDL